jgi:hypothetical protein
MGNFMGIQPKMISCGKYRSFDLLLAIENGDVVRWMTIFVHGDAPVRYATRGYPCWTEWKYQLRSSERQNAFPWLELFTARRAKNP